MGELDVETLLQSGYWPNSRVRSANPRTADTLDRPSHSSQEDRTVPRRVPYHVGHPPYARHPPPPSVEDESDSLAKEAGSIVSSVPSEEPIHRGDPDQFPIILPVHEYNPERRFVLVSNLSDSSSEGSGSERRAQSRRRKPSERQTEPDPESASYKANTGRKYGQPTPREDRSSRKKEAQPERENGRSRPRDLPPIITGAGTEAPSHDTRRAKPTSRTDGRSDDYFSPRLSSTSSRYPRESLLTPDIIEHATNGRDQSYYKGGSSPNTQSRNRSAHSNDRSSRNQANDRKYKERGSNSAQPSSPTLRKRHTSSDVPKYTRRDSKESYEPSRQYADIPPSRSDRKAPSSTYSQSDRDAATQRSPISKEKRGPTQYNDTFYSSEDETRPHADSHRRSSALPRAKTEYLKAPVEARGTDRRKSRGASPLPSPRISQTSISDSYSSSSSSRSATFPRELKPSRDEARPERPLSPTSTARGSFNTGANVIPPVGIAAAVAAATPSSPSTNVSVDSHRPVIPPPQRATPTIDTRAPVSTPPAPTPVQQPSWPPKFEPPQHNPNSVPPITSYRRFSLEVKNGELPDIPHCPRTREEVGHMDWLTLPRCDNFNICPSCYTANFSSTEFAHHFVPMPFRPRDRPLACDFGTSEYYRIAWLFTRKYGKSDLGFFHKLTQIGAQSQPCTGHREVSRIWYTVKDPRTRRPVDAFTVCHACAKSVEALLPSLTGLFVPLDTPAEPARGVCAMHHDRGHDRGRFLLYFDILEGEADRALETQAAPNVQALADRIRELAAVPPCPEGRLVHGALWHKMRSIPEVTVCPECFLMVVRPLLDGRRADVTVAGDFYYDPLPMPKGGGGDCILYSDRMRDVFERAVRRRDLGYLAAKVRERADMERVCNERLAAVERKGLGTAWANAEVERIEKEWRKYE